MQRFAYTISAANVRSKRLWQCNYELSGALNHARNADTSLPQSLRRHLHKDARYSKIVSLTRKCSTHYRTRNNPPPTHWTKCIRLAFLWNFNEHLYEYE